MGSQIHGRATIRIDGQFYDSEPGASIEVGGTTNISRPMTHTVKYSQTYQPGRITCGIPLTDDLSLVQLKGLTGVEVTFETDNGKTFILRNAVQVGAAALAGGDSGGVVQLEFSGDPAEEVVNG